MNSNVTQICLVLLLAVTPTLSVTLTCWTGTWSWFTLLVDGCSCRALLSSLTAGISPGKQRQIVHTESSLSCHTMTDIKQSKAAVLFKLSEFIACEWALISSIGSYQQAALSGYWWWSGGYDFWQVLVWHWTPVHHFEVWGFFLQSCHQREATPPTSINIPVTHTHENDHISPKITWMT